ncbi:MAG: hypothetical protein IKI31_06145, partial [Treponema sp.]|nr:hypothetical protein [Treponema sp.]
IHDKEKNYFEFTTNDVDNRKLTGGSFTYLGTAVYYKIYDSKTTVTSETNTIENKNTSTSSNAATYIIESLKYQPLALDNVAKPVLIDEDVSNRRIYIRLTNDSTAVDPSSGKPMREAKLIIDFAKDTTVTGSGVPKRNVYNATTKELLTFDFGRNQTNITEKIIPQNDDVDSSINNASSTEFYICAYAVAVGRDETYSMYYSPVAYLGCITVDSTNEDN